MGFGDTSMVCKIMLILLILCFIIALIGSATPFWWYLKVDNIIGEKNTFYGGLWESCIETGFTKSCENIKDYGHSAFLDWFRAVRALSIMSLLYFLAALVAIIVFMFFMSERKAVYQFAAFLSFVGAFCALIAFAVYARHSSGDLKEYSASFALTIISFILGLMISVLGILDNLGVVGGK
ncbi:hypothetical protein CHS0354_027225 [Potamilus streckersoni]|uniref:Uncharacterized protein n=1 Tax=Potamilus streckersoni TaxID=2493646 RepID=A0AAE0VV94_9BIVA|nr:hypothetical protein CHS0354_027225 [Potamilus streckersoni]